MPTVVAIGGCRFFFSSSDGSEPRHIHVELDGRVAKFWLEPVELAKGGRLPDHELRRIEKLVVQYRLAFIEAWDDFFSN